MVKSRLGNSISPSGVLGAGVGFGSHPSRFSAEVDVLEAANAFARSRRMTERKIRKNLRCMAVELYAPQFKQRLQDSEVMAGEFVVGRNKWKE
jgi:hypothetical protein